MINKHKNVCYVIQVNAVDVEGNQVWVKFISNHSFNSKRFRAFAKDYLLNHSLVPYSSQSEYGSMTQETISNLMWQDPDVRKRVMDGITESQKCR